MSREKAFNLYQISIISEIQINQTRIIVRQKSDNLLCCSAE